MGASKKEIFTAEQNTIAALIKALGHLAGITIAEHLIRLMPVFAEKL